jgi:hypothetical protein
MFMAEEGASYHGGEVRVSFGKSYFLASVRAPGFPNEVLELSHSLQATSGKISQIYYNII